MKTKVYFPVILAILLMICTNGIGQNASDNSVTQAKSAYRSLQKAGTLNGIALGFAAASNIEMAILGGFPLGYKDGLNPTANLSHMVFGVGRLTVSIFPPIHIAKARKALKPWRESPEMASSCKGLFASLDAAQVLTAAAPVLCLAGGMMMARGAKIENIHVYDYPDYPDSPDSPAKSQAWKIGGWICVGAGLVATISATILIADAKQQLSRKTGTLKLTANSTGVGLSYNLPTK